MLSGSGIGSVLQQIEWAENEVKVEAGICTDKTVGLGLWHTFSLLTPNPRCGDGMRTEFVYRSHCRELLRRVQDGEDTRLATNAELALICSNTSLLAPLNNVAVSCYMHVWQRAFPNKPVFDNLDAEAYTAVAHGADLELIRDMRRKFEVKDRVLNRDGKLFCSGRHNGQIVVGCPYARKEKE